MTNSESKNNTQPFMIYLRLVVSRFMDFPIFLGLICKSSSLSLTTLFNIKYCLYLPQIFYVQWIFISHPTDRYPLHPFLSRITSKSLSLKIHFYPIPHGIWQESPLCWCSTLQVTYFINLFNNTFYFLITYHLSLLILGVE